MKTSIQRFMAFLTIATTTFIYGCGGGGGGADSGITYTGSTSMATVTASNAKALSESAYENIEGSMSTASALPKSTDATSVNVPLLVKVTAIIEEATKKAIAPNTKVSAKTVAAIVTAQDAIPGDYGGSASFSITANDVTGAWSGSFTFNDYANSADVALNGSISFSGIYNSLTDEMTSFSITLRNVSATASSYVFTMNGALSATNTVTGKTITMSVIVTDSTGYMAWIKDFTITQEGNSLTISGTFYHHLHGYVTLTTTSPLIVQEINSPPTAGQILLTGANNTKARITFNSIGYTVEYYSVENVVWSTVA